MTLLVYANQLRYDGDSSRTKVQKLIHPFAGIMEAIQLRILLTGYSGIHMQPSEPLAFKEQCQQYFSPLDKHSSKWYMTSVLSMYNPKYVWQGDKLCLYIDKPTKVGKAFVSS